MTEIKAPQPAPAHTLGPWNATEPRAVLGMDAHGQWYVHGKDCTVACAIDGDRAANARLIAAAPELLAVLTEAFRAFAHDEDGPVWADSTIAKARAAIAKATGAQA